MTIALLIEFATLGGVVLFGWTVRDNCCGACNSLPSPFRSAPFGASAAFRAFRPGADCVAFGQYLAINFFKLVEERVEFRHMFLVALLSADFPPKTTRLPVLGFCVTSKSLTFMLKNWAELRRILAEIRSKHLSRLR